MNEKRFTYYIIIYLCLWAVAVFIPDILFGNSTNIFAKMMTIQVPIAEYGIFSTNLHISTFLEFLIPFIINPIFIFILYHELNNSIPRNPENKWKIWTKYGLISVMMIFSMGYGLHYVGDALDTIIPFEWIEVSLFTNHIPEALIMNYVKVPAYLFDEVISHKLIQIGLFGAYSGLALTQYWYPLDYELNNFEFYGKAALGAAFGGAMTIALVEGQCGFEFLFICFGLLIFIIIQIKRLNINLRSLPFLTFFLFFLLCIVIGLPIWGILTGFKDFYPFFYQLSEI